MSTSAKLILKSLVTPPDVQHAKYTVQDCRCLDKYTPRNAGNDLRMQMGTNASAATRVKKTRVRQTERIMKDLDNPGMTNPSSSSGSGQHKHLRFADQERVDPNLGGDAEMKIPGQEASATRTRSAETDLERLEEGAAEVAETDPDKRTAVKRKAEGDPSDSEVEDSVMNSFANLWDQENDPDSEIDLLIFQQP